MDKTELRGMEWKLYRHYRRLRNLERMKRGLESTRGRIKAIEEDIRNCNFKIENPLKSPSFDGLPKGGTVESPIEVSLIRAYERLENELIRLHSREVGLIEVINRIEEETEELQLVIDGFGEDDRKLVELRYRDGMTFRRIGTDTNNDNSSIYRKICKLICDIMTKNSYNGME